MGNGKVPQTDREWLIQIDSKIEGLADDMKEQRTDTVNIFNRLRAVEDEQTKVKGRCAVEKQRAGEIDRRFDRLPNLSRTIKLWGALFALLQAIIGITVYWKG